MLNIQHMDARDLPVKEYVASEIGVEDGEIIASSKGLHIYDYSFDLAKCLRMRDDMKLKGE